MGGLGAPLTCSSSHYLDIGHSSRLVDDGAVNFGSVRSPRRRIGPFRPAECSGPVLAPGTLLKTMRSSDLSPIAWRRPSLTRRSVQSASVPDRLDAVVSTGRRCRRPTAVFRRASDRHISLMTRRTDTYARRAGVPRCQRQHGNPREVNAMGREFDIGYHRRRFRLLVADYPDESVYPADSFRVEWGPDLPPRPTRRHRPGARHRSGPGDPRDHHPPDPRGRGGATCPGTARPPRHHAQLRVHQHVPVLRLRPGWWHAPHRRQADHALPQSLDQCDRRRAADRGDHHAGPARRHGVPGVADHGARRGEHGGVRKRPPSHLPRVGEPDAARSPRPRRSSASASRGTRRSTCCTAWSPPTCRSRLRHYGDTITNDDLAPIPAVDLPAGCRRGWARSRHGRCAPATTPSRSVRRSRSPCRLGARTWPPIS